VRRSAHRARFLHPRGWSYFSTLRNKLHWASGAHERRRACLLAAPEGHARPASRAGFGGAIA
jgi:hypothetical protein